MATGIKDKVAIIGMGCTQFGERWDCGPEELIVEAFTEARGLSAAERPPLGPGVAAGRGAGSLSGSGSGSG